jgi:hypothetical protein
MIPQIVAAASVVLLGWFLWRSDLVRTFGMFRGAHLVSCPERNDPAVIKTTALLAGLTARWRVRRLQVRSCTHWPERDDCSQPCLLQVRVAPRETKIAGVVRSRYAGQQCDVCGRPIEDGARTERNPLHRV